MKIGIFDSFEAMVEYWSDERDGCGRLAELQEGLMFRAAWGD
jgi:hypothetical protein